MPLLAFTTTKASSVCTTENSQPVHCQRQGRKVTALKFKMRRIARLPEAHSEQRTLFPNLEEMPVIVKELRDAGLSTQDALEIWVVSL